MILDDDYKKWTLAIHLLFWGALAIIMYLVLNSIIGNEQIALVASSVHLAGFMMLVYGHLFYLLPQFFDKKKYNHYALGLVTLLLLTTCFRFFVGWGWSKSMNWGIVQQFTPSFFGSMAFTGIFFLLMSLPLRLIDNWFKRRELEQELKTHQLEAELRFLKAQVNPHFLFNALNNIYSLSFTQAKETPDMILKLSNMMSYMLYDCKSDKVKLASEIDYLKNYIALQQLKKDGEFDIDFQVKGDITTIMLTPMLFIPFFENAFKHGNLEDIKNGWLKSCFEVENNQLTFKIANSRSEQDKNYEKGGVGLTNVKERLRLLYPQSQQLNIKHYTKQYEVELIINLNLQDHDL